MTFEEKYMQKNLGWRIEEDTVATDKRKLHESLFTLSNGYVGMRGINEDVPAGSYPGTFIAGGYNTSESMCVEMVNFPNTLPLYIVIDGEKLDVDTAEVISHKRSLDLLHGAIYRETIFKTGQKKTRFSSLRFVCRHNRNLTMMMCEAVPLNWSGEMKVMTELDGTVHNEFANYFPKEWARHLWLMSINDTYDTDTVMVVRTRDQDYKYCFATYLDVNREFTEMKRVKKMYGERIVEEVTVQVTEGQPLNITKYIAIEDTKHVAEDELVKATTNILNLQKNVDADIIWKKHKDAWENKWDISDVRVATEDKQDDLNARIRFNLYHLLILGHEDDYRHCVSIKGYTGEFYRGHHFWDVEMYMFPFYLYTNPLVARNVLIFRHKTLDVARANARALGCNGAKFSWECDERGREGINNEIDRETGVLRTRETLQQYHVNLAVMYALFNYYRSTRDMEFMTNYGADMMIENMRFFDSFLSYNKELDRYETHNVMGPDEYHANCNNNYYTNYLLKQIAKKTVDFLEECKNTYKNVFYKVSMRLFLNEDELIRWKDIYEKIYLMEPVDNVLEQSEGFFELKDYVVKARNEFGIPRVIELEYLKDPDHPKYTPEFIAFHEELVRMAKDHTFIKQADTVLLFNIFPFDFSTEIMRATLRYYQERTLHYSSLSPAIYAQCAARLGEDDLAREYFELALNMDLNDVKSESEHALHTPTSGEVYTVIIHGYAGLLPDGDALVLDPKLPDNWNSVEFKFLWRKNTLTFKVSNKEVTVAAEGRHETIFLIRGERRTLLPGQMLVMKLQ